MKLSAILSPQRIYITTYNAAIGIAIVQSQTPIPTTTPTKRASSQGLRSVLAGIHGPVAAKIVNVTIPNTTESFSEIRSISIQNEFALISIGFLTRQMRFSTPPDPLRVDHRVATEQWTTMRSRPSPAQLLLSQ